MRSSRSRMIDRRGALRGGMPFYKWLGNQILTAIENRMLGSDLSEFHSGYRAYKVEALESIPFRLNSDDFHFDTEILIQLLSTGRTVTEIPVPTFYGDEISRVNGIRYAANCLKAVCEGSPRPGRAFLRAEVRLRRVRRRAATASRRPITLCITRSSRATWPTRLAGRRPRLEPRRAQRAARRQGRARHLGRRRAPARRGRRRGDRARPQRRLRPGARTPALRLRARARRDRASRAPRGGRRARSPRS